MTTPRRRQLVVLLTDDEWRRLRVLAAEQDTTLTAWTTNVVLAAVQAQTGTTVKPPRSR